MADFNEYKGVWVFCEQRQGALMSTDFELVSEARKLADELGCEVTGLLLGDNVDGIAKELGGYALVDLYADYALNPTTRLFARVNNAFDRDYTQLAGYNTAGREWLVGVNWQPK